MPSVSVTQKQPAAGAWYALDQHALKKRIARIADHAGHIDFLKSSIPDEDQRAKIVEAVSTLHGVAMHYDQLHSWGIYAREDIDCQDVRL